MILCESSLEYDACFHLEYSKDVVSYCSQPTGFYYEHQGKSNPYTPDFLVYFRNGSRKFWEVKPRHQAQKKTFQEKFRAQQSTASEMGEVLSLVTERQIRLNPILNNLKLMHAYNGFYELNIVQSQIIALVWRLGSAPLSHVSQELDILPSEAKSMVLPLLAKGELDANLDTTEFGINSILVANSL